MLNIIRFSTALIILLLIAPQTQKSNIILQFFNDSGFFINYGEAEWCLKFLTWFFIVFFLLISLF